MKQTAYRHGDVVIKKIAALPDGEQKKHDKLILAYGEVTGHCHQITKGDAELIDIPNERGELSTYLSIGEGGALLTHEEHKPIELPQGIYEVVIQREYQPDGWTKVID